MKKFALVLALIMSLSLFAACGSNTSSGSTTSSDNSNSTISNNTSSTSNAASGSANQAASMPADLNDVMDKVYEGISTEELPMLADEATLSEMYGETQKEGDRYRRVSADTSLSDVGVAADAYKEALVSESMIGSIPYCVAVLRAESADAAEKLAADVKAGINPAKWICVEADKVEVKAIDDVVLLVMVGEGFHEVGDKLLANFDSLAQ